MLIAACQAAPNAKHGSFPALKPAGSPVLLKKSCWSQLAKPLRMRSMARFLLWNLHCPYCFWRNHADRSLPDRSECKPWIASWFETCIFPSVFEEIMLIAACQTAPNAKHGWFPVLKPVFSLVFLKKSCWSQLAKPLRMRSIARFLFWNLHFPYCFWRNRADRSLPNRSACKT